MKPKRPKRLVKKKVEVRPYYGRKNRIEVATAGFDEEFESGWCGPIQEIEVEVEEP